MTPDWTSKGRLGVRLYPESLLGASIQAKSEYFFNVRISHSRLADTVAELDRLLEPGLEKSLIVLTGPSGVGKTVALVHFVRQVTRRFFQSYPNDTHCVPAVFLEAWGPERGSFDWHDFYESLLCELQIPLVGDTLPSVTRQAEGMQVITPLVEVRRSVSLRCLRNRVRQATQYRKPVVLAVDEASNILSVSDSQTIKRQANALKSVANFSKSRIILAGAYDLFSLLTQSGQLARRGAVVHFEPYSQRELEPFVRAMLTLQNHMPLKHPASLEQYGGEIFKQSLGCIGLMKTILHRCLSIALERDCPIDREILSRSYYKPVQLAQLKQEMLDGFKLVEGQDFFQSARELRPEETNESQPAARRPRPGQRNPSRDRT